MEKSPTHGNISLQIGLSSLEETSKLPEITLCKSLFPNSLFLVGGSVRDAFLNHKKTDLDLATGITPEEIIKILDKNRVPYITTGLKHGTITIIKENQIELTYFRGEVKDLNTDLSLRDFTINAMAYDLHNHRFIDPFQGLIDLENGKIRLTENNENLILDDPLRIIRAIRFHSESAFEIDSRTLEKILRHSEKLYTVAQERITAEFSKILCGKYTRSAFEILRKINFFDRYFPQLLDCVGFEQNEFHTEDVYNHIMSVIERTEPDLKLRLAALFHDMAKPKSFSVSEEGRRHFYMHEYLGISICREAMNRLMYPKALTKAVCLLVETHMRPTSCGAPGVRRLLRKLGEEYNYWLKLKLADKPPIFSDEETLAELDKFKNLVEQETNKSLDQIQGRISVNGDDLIKIGYVPGKKLGKVLDILKNLVIDEPELDVPEKLLKIAEDELKK